MKKLTAEEAERMYAEWQKSGSTLEFAEFFNLGFYELAEIVKLIALEREKRKGD
jgi:hypothetical protein